MKFNARALTRRIGLTAVFTGSLLWMAWPAAATAAPGLTASEITLGQALSLQQGKNDYAVAALQGMQLYLNLVNRQGGVHGRKLVLRTLDDGGQVAMADALARKLVQDGAFLLFGPVEGGPSTAVAKVATETGTPLFGPLAGPPGLRRPHQALVFPVRAEHREEFRALLHWGQKTGLKTVGLLHADSPAGREHLANVQKIAGELGQRVVLTLPFSGKLDDAAVRRMADDLAQAGPALMLNHGSAELYGRLVLAARAKGARTTFMAVNSGSSQLSRQLGDAAKGMVFSQVVPSPWERKTAIAREYQDAMRSELPDALLNYGGLEGYMTAKALVMGLRATGRELTREALVRTLESSQFDLGGVRVRYRPGDHEGSQFVDLSMVNREGRFIH